MVEFVMFLNEVGKLEDRHKADRIRVVIPVMVEGEGPTGKPFSEETVIVDLNSYGAGFRLKPPVLKEDELKLTLEPSCCRRIKNARVARVAGSTNPWDVGVVFQTSNASRETAPEFP